MYKRFPSAKVQYLPQLNRWLHMERPDTLLQVFAEFFIQQQKQQQQHQDEEFDRIQQQQ